MSKAILLIDIGFLNMGWAVVKDRCLYDHGTIERPKPSKRKTAVRVADADMEYCGKLHSTLCDIVLKYQVRGVVAELPGGGAQSKRACECMAMSKAVVACLVDSGRLPAEWVTPSEVKQAVTGKKTATKEEVTAGVKQYFNFDGELSEHEADSLGAYVAARDGQLVRLLEAKDD